MTAAATVQSSRAKAAKRTEHLQAWYLGSCCRPPGMLLSRAVSSYTSTPSEGEPAACLKASGLQASSLMAPASPSPALSVGTPPVHAVTGILTWQAGKKGHAQVGNTDSVPCSQRSVLALPGGSVRLLASLAGWSWCDVCLAFGSEKALVGLRE